MVNMVSKIVNIIDVIIDKLDNISHKNKLKIGYLVMFFAILTIIFILFKIILIIF